MIQANELRIGNWVMDYREGYALEVTTGMLSNWYVLKRDYGGYEAIPITKEWLIDLGFKDMGSHEYLIDYVFILENEYTDAGVWNVCFGDSYITEIKYIHELQNLYFAITGKELTKQKPA